jgi:hypothetical protein
MAKQKDRTKLVLGAIAAIIVIYFLFVSPPKQLAQDEMSIIDLQGSSSSQNITVLKVYFEFEWANITTAKPTTAVPQQLFDSCDRGITVANPSSTTTRVSCELNQNEMFALKDTTGPWFLAISYQDESGIWQDPITSTPRAVELQGIGCTSTSCDHYQIISKVVNNE